jgi:serine/threonine protein kinase
VSGSLACGELLGQYELLLELGSGGMGKVYIAKHVQQSDLVALKVPKSEVLERDGGAAAFLREIGTASGLHHPNIVRMYTSGTAADGRLYLVMQLLEGGTLAEKDNRERFREPKRALALMIQIARAVQFAHDRLVLHCDLKPANILLDSDGEPHVSDFGLARVIGKPGSTYRGTVQGGTPGWMSPEQVERKDLTVASDVFSLGVMLHWLLTDELPFGSGDDFVAQVVHKRPAPSRGWRWGLGWELGQIRWKAMEASPEDRYPSAAALADDLERARDIRPIQAERHLPLRRAGKWVRRHPLAAAGGLQLLLLLLYVALMPISLLREVRSTIRTNNASAVVFQAGNVMSQLRSFAARAAALAADPALRDLVHHADLYKPPSALAERISGFDNISVFEWNGTLRARYPLPTTRYTNLDFSYRNYSRTREQIVGRVRGTPPIAYVSRAFYSATDRHLHIGFSAPLFDEDDNPVGFVLATAMARSTFGAVQMNCAGNGDCMTALLGLRDRDRNDQPLPTTLNVVAEPGLEEGQDAILDDATSRRICRTIGCTPGPPGKQLVFPANPQSLTLDDYEDPVSHTRSIAALAAVGNTGLVVVVATPNSAADALTRRLIDRMKAFLWIPIVPALLLLVVLIGGSGLARRRARRSAVVGSPRRDVRQRRDQGQRKDFELGVVERRPDEPGAHPAREQRQDPR